jgi:enterochelin esterase family protein
MISVMATKFMAGLMLAWTSFSSTPGAFAEEPQKYEHGPDSQRKEGVPQGKIEKFELNDSKIYPGTFRECAIYIPAQYKGEPTALMVFQDGHTYLGDKGDFRVPVVFDNLIHAKELPPIIGVFINPGNKGKLPDTPWKTDNRSVEYDTLGDTYSKFLHEDVLPRVKAKYNITDDPNQRAICGISSGGICAFTVAWERPDSFRKVMTQVGSFTDIRGGYVYPTIIRKQEKKPIKVFLQANEFDVDNQFGNWFLANKQMASSFKFKGYDYKIVEGKGPHNGNFGGVIFPDASRWLWADVVNPDSKPATEQSGTPRAATEKAATKKASDSKSTQKKNGTGVKSNSTVKRAP